MEAVADEIAQRAAAFRAVRLPVPDPHPRAIILDIPIDGDVAQAPDRALLQQLLRLAPDQDRRKIEVDHGCPATGRCGACHRFGVRPAGRDRLLRKNRLAEFESPHRDRGLQAGRRRNGDGIDLRVLDQLRPMAEGQRDIGVARQPGGACSVAAGQSDHLTARIEAKRRKMNQAAIITSDDSNPYHESSCGGPGRAAITLAR